ncbi:hypothetical protein FACS1894184_19470 [Clostridia bacterium]|nr:hypothetical protein FACS1894184_19470 [Clostridia bacterium]
MANVIAPSAQWVPMFDEAYRLASLTGLLDSPADFAKWTHNAHKLEIPNMLLPGLADYDRTTGYANADISIETQIIDPTYERGVRFVTDTLDVSEAMGEIGEGLGQLIRQSYAPELDAWRIATYAAAEGVGKETGALETGEAVILALRVAVNAMDNAECPDSERVLFILPSLIGAVEDLDTTASRAVLARFGTIVRTPPSRMYETVSLDASGYTGTGALNFLAVAKSAVIQVQKHIAPKIISPEADQEGDRWLVGFRSTGYCAVYENKVAGVFAHIAA